MRFNDDTRSQITVNMTLTRDPADATLELNVDGAWHDCTWDGTAVEANGEWKQAALTDDFFAGPAATANGATVLDVGRHNTETRTTWPDGTVIVENSSPIDVRER